MKTAAIFSDIHCSPLPSKLRDVANESDYVFFLGDGNSSVFAEFTLHKGFHCVRGNCDSLPFPSEKIIEIEKVKILLTHGHTYGVKRDLLPLALRAKELDCQAAFYGHTHLADITVHDEVTLICPGSIYAPAYGTASYVYTVFNDGKFFSHIAELN